MTVSQIDIRKWDGTSLSEAHGDALNSAIDKINELVDTVNGNAVVAGVGLLADLDTVDQSSIVDAINEVVALTDDLKTATEVVVPIPLLAGQADGGTWTKAVTSGGLVSVARTAADAPDSFWCEIPFKARTASGSFKPTGLRVNYQVATADVSDVRFEVWKVTQGADNAARTAAVLFGDDNADYDAAHNTTAERGDDTAAPELHLATLADAGTPAALAVGETLLLRCYVDGDAGAAGVVTVTSAELIGTETLAA